MLSILYVVAAYLLGSVSFSVIIAKKLKQVDIRQHGSGNAGATNTLRVLGIGPAIVVLLLDCLKGVVAVWGSLFLTGDPLVASASGLAAIVGHNWPIYYGFRGGKGVATTIGVLVSLVFLAALVSGIIAIISIVISRYVSLGSLLFISGTTILTIVFSTYYVYPTVYLYFLIVITALSFWRHRTNIARLVKGTENKIGQKAPSN
ncbi:glycerol-3-phosphate 1-O-acyltransferase PlsY [Alteribacter populi]|uniref:glycerol-3-phosphate 1-O-acyltransferase PlsY n=1 Tax=Alteribacter populi TaxID=2011011 RepID=UPI000BBB567E|nr:glycerol-3-phosphate 1-O-acyltransferase PlsY [Alteribacter populi]